MKDEIAPNSLTETLDVDFIFVATGYRRDAHVGILEGCEKLAAKEGTTRGPEKNFQWSVGRDYRVKFGDGQVDENAGIWLQGCNEKTHGVSF